MSTGNQEYIRDMNRALVLEAIANHPPLSRADLAKMLHLTKATVSTIVQELLDRQLVIELGSAEKTSMGRKPILLTFNNRCGSIIAVDLGVKKITILTGDLKGKSCTVKEYPIDPSLSLEEYLISLLHKTKSDLPQDSVRPRRNLHRNLRRRLRRPRFIHTLLRSETLQPEKLPRRRISGSCHRRK